MALASALHIVPEQTIPGRVKFEDGCRLRWIGSTHERAEVIRIRGEWFYWDTNAQDDGLFPGDPTESSDEIYSREILAGDQWEEILDVEQGEVVEVLTAGIEQYRLEAREMARALDDLAARAEAAKAMLKDASVLKVDRTLRDQVVALLDGKVK